MNVTGDTKLSKGKAKAWAPAGLGTHERGIHE